MRKSRRTGTILVALVAVAVVVCGLLLWLREPSKDSTASAESTVEVLQPTERVSVLWVGDDFTAGLGGAIRNAYPFILCRASGWNCNVDAVNGSGLVGEDGAVSSELSDRLAVDAKLYRVDLLLIDLGRNDLGSSTDAIAPALRAFVGEASRLWPSARIVMIMPTFMSAEPYGGYDALRASVQGVLDEVGGVVIDPIADGWYVDADIQELQISDNAHPNAPGNQLIARRIGESLEKRGLGLLGSVN